MAVGLSMGLNVLTQNVAAALPARVCRIFTDGVAPTLQHSTTEAFTANVAITLADGQAELSSGFIRCTNLATLNVWVSPVG